MAKVSVIVPVYKVEKYLGRCIESILNQTFQDFELILVDDGSPDNCPKICDDYAKKYNNIHVIHKENGGAADARNFGIEHALKTDSDYITFIDSDDAVESNYLEILYNLITMHEVDVSCCNYYTDENHVKFNSETIVTINSPESITCNQKLDIWSPWAKLFKKHLFNNIRFPKGKRFEDAYTIYKVLFSCKKIAHTNQTLYFYFQNQTGLTEQNKKIEFELERSEVYCIQAKWLYENNFVKACEEVILNNYYPHLRVTFMSFERNRSVTSLIIKHDNKMRRKFFVNFYTSAKIKQKDSVKKYIKRFKKFNFKKDLDNIMQEKGKLYAFLYRIKNFWKVF